VSRWDGGTVFALDRRGDLTLFAFGAISLALGSVRRGGLRSLFTQVSHFSLQP